ATNGAVPALGALIVQAVGMLGPCSVSPAEPAGAPPPSIVPEREPIPVNVNVSTPAPPLRLAICEKPPATNGAVPALGALIVQAVWASGPCSVSPAEPAGAPPPVIVPEREPPTVNVNVSTSAPPLRFAI